MDAVERTRCLAMSDDGFEVDRRVLPDTIWNVQDRSLWSTTDLLCFWFVKLVLGLELGDP